MPNVVDENGKLIQLEEPYYDARKRRWFGEEPPRRSPDNPPCPYCEEETETVIHMHGHIDSDGAYRYPVYHCRACRREF